jgi:hypothetical protein
MTLDKFCYYCVGDIFGNVTIYRIVNEIESDNNSIKFLQNNPIIIIKKLRNARKKFFKNVFSKIKKIKLKRNKKNKNEEDINEEKENDIKDVEVFDNEDKIEDNIIEGGNIDNKIEEENKIEENTGKYYYAKIDRVGEKNIFKVELFNKLYAHNEQIRYIDFNGRLNLFLTYALDGYVNLYLFPSCKMINAIKISKVTGNAIFTKVLLISNPFPMFICLNDELLYGSEIKRYKKQGFDVSHTLSSLKNLNHSNVDWSNAFKNGVPYQVYSYICGETSAYPRVYVHNLAQELYVIAEYTINHRKSY